MKLKKWLSLLLVALLIVSVLSACGSKGNDATPDGGKKDDGKSDSGKSDSGKKDDGGSAPAGQPSKTVVFSTSENAIRMDPHRDNNNGGHVIKQCIFETLFWCDRYGNFMPELATEWEWKDNDMTLDMKLREGVKFHNGNPFNADSVIGTFNRILDKDNPNMSSYVENWKHLDNIEKVDDYHIIFHFNNQDAETMYFLHTLMIFDAKAFEEYGDAYFENGNLWGTGPWKFIEWIDGQYAKLEKNTEWWNIGNRDSYYDELIIRHILEPTTAVAAHLSGDINVNMAVGGIGKDLLPLYDNSERDIELFTWVEGSYYYLQEGFTVENSPFKDENFRKAFELCIDRQAIVDNIYGGGIVPSTTVLPMCFGGVDPQEPRPYDPELAKEYLAKSNYDGYDLEFMGNTSTYRGEETLLAVADYCRAVGINAHVKMEEYASFNERRNTKNYDLFLIINMARNSDQINTLRYRILEDRQGSSFYDAHMNELIDKACHTVDFKARLEIEKEISNYMFEIAGPQVALCQCEATYAWDKGIAGIVLYPDGENRFQYVTYDPDNPVQFMNPNENPFEG